jgi:hypothetical protein
VKSKTRVTSKVSEILTRTEAAMKRDQCSPGIAGAVSVQEGEELGVGLPPGRLDGRAVAPVLLEDDELDLAPVALGDLDRSVGGAVADDRDLHLGYRRFGEDPRPRCQSALDDRTDAFLLVESRNGNEELQSFHVPSTTVQGLGAVLLDFPELSDAHIQTVCEIRLARRLWPKLDALATMNELERPTYEQWLTRPHEIRQMLIETFTPELVRTAWGKLLFVGRAGALG